VFGAGVKHGGDCLKIKTGNSKLQIEKCTGRTRIFHAPCRPDRLETRMEYALWAGVYFILWQPGLAGFPHSCFAKSKLVAAAIRFALPGNVFPRRRFRIDSFYILVA
jgi:hypothetical protein